MPLSHSAPAHTCKHSGAFPQPQPSRKGCGPGSSDRGPVGLRCWEAGHAPRAGMEVTATPDIHRAAPTWREMVLVKAFNLRPDWGQRPEDHPQQKAQSPKVFSLVEKEVHCCSGGWAAWYWARGQWILAKRRCSEVCQEEECIAI